MTLSLDCDLLDVSCKFFANYFTVCFGIQSHLIRKPELVSAVMGSCQYSSVCELLVYSGVNMGLYLPFVRHHYILQLYRHVLARAVLERGGGANIGSTMGLGPGVGPYVGKIGRAGSEDGGIPARGGNPEGDGPHDGSGNKSRVVMDIRDPNFRLYLYLDAPVSY